MLSIYKIYDYFNFIMSARDLLVLFESGELNDRKTAILRRGCLTNPSVVDEWVKWEYNTPGRLQSFYNQDITIRLIILYYNISLPEILKYPLDGETATKYLISLSFSLSPPTLEYLLRNEANPNVVPGSSFINNIDSGRDILVILLRAGYDIRIEDFINENTYTIPWIIEVAPDNRELIEFLINNTLNDNGAVDEAWLVKN